MRSRALTSCVRNVEVSSALDGSRGNSSRYCIDGLDQSTVLVRMSLNSTDALKVKEGIKPVPDFHTLRHTALSPQQNLAGMYHCSEKVRNASDNNRILVDTFLIDTQQNLDALEAFTGRNTFYDASGKTQNTQSSLSLKV